MINPTPWHRDGVYIKDANGEPVFQARSGSTTAEMLKKRHELLDFVVARINANDLVSLYREAAIPLATEEEAALVTIPVNNGAARITFQFVEGKLFGALLYGTDDIDNVIAHLQKAKA